MNGNKVILVTGATRGLGLAITKQLLKEGFYIIAIGRSESEELVNLRSAMSTPNHLVFKKLDLKDTSEIHTFITNCAKEHGPIYGLVNNAAIGLDGILATMHESEILEMININITSAILLTKYASRSMLTKRKGRIVNISSIIAVSGFNGLSVYAATKSALVGFTKSLARELGRADITVNAILPGFMATDMTSGLDHAQLQKIIKRTPLGRLPSVDDVAAMVSFLMSDSGQSVTGAAITIDSGSSC